MSNEFKLVPVEPTEEMLNAGDRAAKEGGCDLYGLKRELSNGYAAMLAAAPQPPALGGEPETLAWLVRDSRDGQYSAHRHNPTGWAHGYDVSELIDRAHLAPLQAEYACLLGEHEDLLEKFNNLSAEQDQLKARCDELEGLLQMFIDNSDDTDVVELSRNALSKPAGSDQ
ncbi:hypothetical protein ACTACK_10305 [Pseudomonas syringae]|uniref:hypothetical protein n=1 Tax=Pseudomonas syringae TaxID=317 RepID=UPI003F74DDF2